MAEHLLGQFVVLIQFRTVQRCSDESTFTAGVGQDASFVSSFSGCGAPNVRLRQARLRRA